jgi:hypothetical protein
METVDVVTGGTWTTLRISGDARRPDIIAAIQTHLPKLTKPNVIWDLTDASMDTLGRADFEAIAIAAKASSQKRENAKTAFVGKSPEAFAMVCMYTGLAVLADVSVEYSAFRTLAEAERWIA